VIPHSEGTSTKPLGGIRRCSHNPGAMTASPQTPILLFGSYGELDVFASLDDAERAIDPWSLSDGQLSACDASGRMLRVLSIGASVRLTDTGASQPEVIRARLSERLREDGELDRLVARAIERYGFKR
jgi:hypothetical protein